MIHPKNNSKGTMWGRMVLVCLAMAFLMPSLAQAKSKIMIVPFYVEDGLQAKDAGELSSFYRRVISSVEDRLPHGCFKVASVRANDAMLNDSNRLSGRPMAFSSGAREQLCHRYGVSAVYIVTVEVFRRETPDGYVVLEGQIYGDGYNVAGDSVRVSVNATRTVSGRSFKQALNKLAPQIGDVVGGELSASYNGDCGPLHYALKEGSSNSVTINVAGNTHDETIEAIGKIIRSSTGVRKGQADNIELITSYTDPQNTMMSKSVWEIELNGQLSQEVLKANILKNAKDIVKAGGNAFKRGIPYRYDYNTIRELAGLTTGNNYGKGNLSLEINFNKMKSWERSNRRR